MIYLYLFALLLILTLVLSAFTNRTVLEYHLYNDSNFSNILIRVFKKEKYLKIVAHLSQLLFLILFPILIYLIYSLFIIYSKSPVADNLPTILNIQLLGILIILGCGASFWYLIIHFAAKELINKSVENILNPNNKKLRYSSKLVYFKPIIVEKVHIQLESKKSNAIKSIILFAIITGFSKLPTFILGENTINYIKKLLESNMFLVKIPLSIYLTIIIVIVFFFGYIIINWVYTKTQIQNFCMEEIYSIEKTIRFKDHIVIPTRKATNRFRRRKK